jgi:putative oxidoreductase
MKITVIIARILLGLMFVFFGLNGFLQFLPVPPLTGVVKEFVEAISSSHFLYGVCAIQVIGGALLLSGQFVPLGLALLGPVIYNILLYHITMDPAGIGPGILATILWFIVFWWHRAAFAPLFAQRS